MHADLDARGRTPLKSPPARLRRGKLPVSILIGASFLLGAGGGSFVTAGVAGASVQSATVTKQQVIEADKCLDGQWSQDSETVHAEIETTPVALSGGAGATLYLVAKGGSRFVATPTITLVGSFDGTNNVVVSQIGQWTFSGTVIDTDGKSGDLEMSNTTTTGFFQSGTFNGQALHVTLKQGTSVATYTCSGNTLTITTVTRTRIATFTRQIAATVGMATVTTGGGYWVAHATGAVSAHGSASFFGSMAGANLAEPIKHIVATPNGLGYWLVASDGGTFAFGNAGFFGSMGGKPLNAPIVDIAPTSNGEGYWLVASDGGIFAFGNAAFFGSTGSRTLNAPIVGMAPDDATGGYWLVASDGGVFSFGAPFFGSTGARHLNDPVVGMTPAAGDEGYWFVASDGGLFAYGDALFHGSTGSRSLSSPVVGMAADIVTGGYWEVAATGGVFAFDAPFFGAG